MIEHAFSLLHPDRYKWRWHIFHFICKRESNLLDKKFRDVLPKVICENEILHEFNTSHEF